MSNTFLVARAMRFRSNASACGIFAANALSSSDRELLLRMQDSWLSRARHADWIDGQPPRPPAGSNALAVPRI
jgi:hypothetical protein